MIAILGAGPAGLAVAHALRRRGVPARIYEAGSQVAAGLRTLDPDLPLVSPPGLSWPHLPWPPGRRTFGGLVQALEAWSSELDIVFDFKVLDVEQVEAGYRLRGPSGVVEAAAVVGCTGIVSQPRLPPGLGPTAIPWWHTRDVRPHHVQGRRDLLVVGGGVSAGEVLATWLGTAAPTDRAALALRSPLRTAPHHLLGLDTHYLAWLPEHLPARLGERRLGLRTEPLLDAVAQRALRRGRIEKVSGFQRLEGEEVTLADGSVRRPDAVIFATGYHHTTPVDPLLRFDVDGWPVLRRCEARPGLYVVGMRFARSLASPFLRGIGRDAEYVARQLAGRWPTAPGSLRVTP